MLDDTKKQDGQAVRAIADKMLLLFAGTDMITNQALPMSQR